MQSTEPAKNQTKYLTLSNFLTAFRLVGGIALCFLPPLALSFLVLYTLCGLTDALDGPIARRTGTVSQFGSRLDSIADLTFYLLSLLRVLPILREVLPTWIWTWVSVILASRLAIYVFAACKFRCFASLHTWLNKGTGLLLYGVPYLVRAPIFFWYAAAICGLASLAALLEFLIHLTSKTYDPTRKSFYRKAR